MRSLACDKIIKMRNLLQSINPEYEEQRKMAISWFSEFNSDFNLENAANIKLNKKLVDMNVAGVTQQANSEDRSSRIGLIIVLS